MDPAHKLIDLILIAARGRACNAHLAMHWREDGEWYVECGNPAAHCVSLGESEGEFQAVGRSLEEALWNLLQALTAPGAPLIADGAWIKVPPPSNTDP